MKTIKIDFRKIRDIKIDSEIPLTEDQITSLKSLPPEVDILNLKVVQEGNQIIIMEATSQYYSPQTHEFSGEIPMTWWEIEDMIDKSSYKNINETLQNCIE